MRVYFVRHGESVGNTLENSPRKVSWEEYDKLSELGWQQARSLGKRLDGEGLTHVLVSKLRRAQETAEAINETLGLPMDTLSYIHEHQAAKEYLSVTGEKRSDLLPQVWMPEHNDDPDFLVEGAESFNQMVARVMRLRQYLEAHAGEKNILVVTHGHFLRFYLGTVIFGDQFEPRHFGLLSDSCKTANTGITIFEHSQEGGFFWPEHGWRLVTWMDRNHL